MLKTLFAIVVLVVVGGAAGFFGGQLAGGGDAGETLSDAQLQRKVKSLENDLKKLSRGTGDNSGSAAVLAHERDEHSTLLPSDWQRALDAHQRNDHSRW